MELFNVDIYSIADNILQYIGRMTKLTGITKSSHHMCPYLS